jgi:hypothetical protein
VGRAKSSYELDAGQSIQRKFFLLHYFGPSGLLHMEGIRAFQIPFLLLVVKKDPYNDIFARILLHTK